MNDFRKMMKIDYYDLSLRLIGLYLHPMDANISKNLKPGWYPFGKYPEPQIGFIEVPPVSDIAANIYKTSYKSPKITVGCIVGKNGAGKSSLLDIFYRIINNLACALSCANSTSKCKITKCFCKSIPLVLRNSIFFLVSH